MSYPPTHADRVQLPDVRAHVRSRDTRQRAVNEGCFLGEKSRIPPLLDGRRRQRPRFITGTSPVEAALPPQPVRRQRGRLKSLRALTQGQAGDPKKRPPHLARGQKDTACTAAALLYDSGLQISEMASFPWARAALGCRTVRNHITFL